MSGVSSAPRMNALRSACSERGSWRLVHTHWSHRGPCPRASDSAGLLFSSGNRIFKASGERPGLRSWETRPRDLETRFQVGHAESWAPHQTFRWVSAFEQEPQEDCPQVQLRRRCFRWSLSSSHVKTKLQRLCRLLWARSSLPPLLLGFVFPLCSQHMGCFRKNTRLDPSE